MTTSNRRVTVTTALLVVSSFLVVHLFYWLLPNVFEPWNAQTIDQLFLLRESTEQFRLPYDSTIVHVNIFDKSLLRLKNLYLSRAEYAQVVHNLGEMGVAAQLWDFIFPAKTNQRDDSLLVASTARAGNVYYGLAFRLKDEHRVTKQQNVHQEYLPRQTPARWSGGSVGLDYLEQTKWNIKVEGDVEDFSEGINPIGTFLELAGSSKGLGFLNLNPDRDGVFRRAPLLLRFADGFYPSVSFRLICEYLNVTSENIVLRPGKSIILKNARRDERTLHDIVIPIDKQGNMIVNYLGPWQAMKHYDFADILLASEDADEMDLWTDELGGKIVVVSQVTTGSADIGHVPTDHSFPKSAIHANVMHAILTGKFLKELTDVEMLIVEVVLMLLVFMLSIRFSSFSVSLAILGVLVVYLLAGTFLFLQANTIVNVIRPSLMIVMALLSILAYRYISEEKEKAVLQRSFEAYFPPAVVKKIMMNPNLITTAGQKKELTILFSDIKGFTKYSATLPPDEIQKLLNEYFEDMIDIVFNYGGTVDKFIGDGLMVFFGDPEPQSDHALRCVRTAIAMQKKTGELKADWEKKGKMPIEIRIGINTGVVVVGNMGSSRRLSYTALGADVNLAQRLETNAPVGGILISQRTYELVKDHITTRPLGQINVKGIDEPITVYEVPIDGYVTI